MSLRRKMILPKKNMLLGLSILLLFLSSFFQLFTPVFGQVNLVEEEDLFRIYSGENYNIIIPKNKGPEISFEKTNFGELKLKFSYLSEYFSPSTYLSSMEHLTGKAYNLNYLLWEAFGVSEPTRAYVNMSRGALDHNASLTFSIVSLDTNKSINGYKITPLESTFLELTLTNWTFSAGTNGLAFRIVTFLEEPNYYERLGPFVDIENDQYVVQILGAQYIFELRFNQFLTILTDKQKEESYFSMFFVNYNIATKEHAPADFWVSIPSRGDIRKIILTFVCTIIPQQTASTNGFTMIAIIVSLATMLYSKKWLNQRRKRGVRNE